MHRRQVLTGMVLLGCFGCERRAGGVGVEAHGSDDWIAPPRILSASRRGNGLVIRGETSPNSRVVLRAQTGEAYAAMANASGSFALTVPKPTSHMLYQPEVQNGESAIQAPDLLLVVDGGRGPLALLRAGSPTRRLDGPQVLGAVDADPGRALLSGQVPASQETVRVGTTMGVKAYRLGPDGQWVAAIELGGPQTLQVDNRSFVWPGLGQPNAAPPSYERTADGWRVIWQTPGGGWQSTWLPDAT